MPHAQALALVEYLRTNPEAAKQLKLCHQHGCLEEANPMPLCLKVACVVSWKTWHKLCPWGLLALRMH
eukprot:1155146-Pelagomonas_calceolata.AAC.1